MMLSLKQASVHCIIEICLDNLQTIEFLNEYEEFNKNSNAIFNAETKIIP